VIIHLDKKQNKVLRWISKAAAKGTSRPVLAGINVDGALVGCDGFRLHAAKVPAGELEHAQGQTLAVGKVPASAQVVDVETVDTDTPYPDYSVCMPAPTDEPCFEFAVDAKLLREALEGMKGRSGIVRLRFYAPAESKYTGELFNHAMEVYGELEDGMPGYALIMPIHLTCAQGLDWKPNGKE